MTPVIKDVGGHGPALCFAHANGYPPESYKQLFTHLRPYFTISALEHRPLWGGRTPPRRLSWRLFAEDMLQALDKHYDRPVWVMGHSMGAVTAAIAASRAPERFAGLVLLDPVFLSEKIVLTTRFLPERQRRKLPMVRRALGRPEHFDSFDEAFDFYRPKRAFQGFSDEALRDYVEASKAPEPDGRVRLRYSGEWEAAVYASPPRVRRTLRSLSVPTIGLRGRDSDVLSPEIYARWPHWQPSARLGEVAGGHLFPLEHPMETAEAIVSEVFRDQTGGTVSRTSRMSIIKGFESGAHTMGKILIVADRGKSCAATSRGLELAAKLGHQAEVVAFAYAPLSRVTGGESARVEARQRILDARREEVQERIDKFASGEQRVALKVVWMKDIHPWINKRASSVEFAAVVKTSHATGSLTYTSTDWHLLRECPAPVLLVAENKWHRTKPVMAALDLGSKKKSKRVLNEKILETSKTMAEALGVELKIISAIEVPTMLADLDLVDPDTYAREHREELLPHLKALAKKFDIPEKAFVTKRGPVDKVITSQAAKARAQIVIIGTVARQGIKAKLLGNTAESVLQQLRTDIIAIKP